MAEHRETIGKLYRAFAEGDIASVLGALAADVRWTEAEGFPYRGTHIGPDAVLQNVFARIGAEWVDYRAVPDELIVSGDTVVALGEYSGTYKATGKQFRAPFVHVFRMVGEQVARFQQHTDTALVQRALQ